MEINYLIVHCSDSPNEREVAAEDIHRWHGDPKPKGNGWAGIGYHAVIQRCGAIQKGRPEYWMGAHVKGHNHESLGVCLIGCDEFTDMQYQSLFALINEWKHRHPGAQVLGHRDLDKRKTCPNFDAGGWYNLQIQGMQQ